MEAEEDDAAGVVADGLYRAPERFEPVLDDNLDVRLLGPELRCECPRREVVSLADARCQDEDADGGRPGRRARDEYVPNTMSQYGTLTPNPRSSSSK